MKHNHNSSKILVTGFMLAVSLILGSASCSDSTDVAPKAKTKEAKVITCPNTGCKYTRPGDPESLSVVDTCPDCGAKLKQ